MDATAGAAGEAAPPYERMAATPLPSSAAMKRWTLTMIPLHGRLSEKTKTPAMLGNWKGK